MDYKRVMAERNHARAKEIRRVTWVGFWSNLFPGLFKIAAGYFGNSRSIHSLCD